jgi:hypothetical protein
MERKDNVRGRVGHFLRGENMKALMRSAGIVAALAGFVPPGSAREEEDLRNALVAAEGR